MLQLSAGIAHSSRRSYRLESVRPQPESSTGHHAQALTGSLICRHPPCFASVQADDWASCPCGHKGERAARRDLQTHPYVAIACAYAKQVKLSPATRSCWTTSISHTAGAAHTDGADLFNLNSPTQPCCMDHHQGLNQQRQATT